MQGVPIQPPIFFKNPTVATLLSFFFMGLGQFYNGQIAKGILFIVMYAISIGLMFRLRSPHRPLSATQNNWHNPKLLCSQWVRCFHLGQESLGWPTP
jgi:hypothetical protein